MNVDFLSIPPILPQVDGRSTSAKAESGDFQEMLANATAPPDKLTNAARQFEALIVGQVIKAARESSDSGWLGTGDDQAGELALEMAEQEFARAFTVNGGLGIAKVVTDNLRRHPAKAASSGPAESAPPTDLHTDSTR